MATDIENENEVVKNYTEAMVEISPHFGKLLASVKELFLVRFFWNVSHTFVVEFRIITWKNIRSPAKSWKWHRWRGNSKRHRNHWNIS